jgi:hypothetical protein
MKAEKAALEAAIQSRHATLTALVDKLRDDQLTALTDMCRKIDEDLASDIREREANRQQLRQLMSQVDAALGSGKSTQLLNVAKKMREGRGSIEAVESLKTTKRKCVTKPSLTFAMTDIATRQRVRDALTAMTKTVMMEVTPPEVTVKVEFRCGHETDIRVFSLCPMDNNN